MFLQVEQEIKEAAMNDLLASLPGDLTAARSHATLLAVAEFRNRLQSYVDYELKRKPKEE